MTSDPKLIAPKHALRSGAGIPSGFYLVLKEPAPLAGCALPGTEVDWALLYRAGFRHVFCLCSETPRYTTAPLKLAAATELDDLSIRRKPVQPRREAQQCEALSEAVASRLQRGEGVLIHCAAGRGRTGTVLGRCLVRLGLPASSVVEYLNDLHLLRSGHGWPESPWQSEFLKKTLPGAS